MANTIAPNEWLPVLRKEYLQDFIKRGGAAVKFVVPMDDAGHQWFVENLKRVAEQDGYLFVPVDSATTKVHMIDQVFYAIAKQVAWDDLAYGFLCSTLSEAQYRVPANRDDFGLRQLASLNSLDLGEMRREINIRMRDRIFRDYAMTQEFRIAMLRLCQAQLEPQDVSAGTADAVKQWLHGELRLISALRSALIFQRIGRHNGRHMLFSLSHWLHVNGKAGLVIALDISQFLEARRPSEPTETIQYSYATAMDGYEVLRQCVDGTDEIEFFLLVVMAPPSFLTDERRGLKAYQALEFRIFDEVHDRDRPNPLSPLVRLSSEDWQMSNQP